MSAFEIEWDGQPKVEAHTLGIAITSHEERSCGVGRMGLTYRVAATADDLIPAETKVGVWRGSDRIFYGRALRRSLGGRVRTVELVDPWWELQNSTYFKPSVGLLNLNVPTSPQVSEIWDYLRVYGTDYLTDHLTWPAFADTGLAEIWHHVVHGLSHVQVASNLAQLMGNYPFACLRWNHQSTPPTMQIVNPGDYTITLDAESQAMAINITPNDGQRVTAVTARATLPWREWLDEEAMSNEVLERLNGFLKSDQVDAYPSGESEGGPNILCNFIQDYFTYGVPAGALAYAYSLLNQPIFNGTITVKGINSVIRVGTTISVSNSHPDLAAMAMPVQAVSNDYATDTQTLTIGPSASLSGDSLIERFKAFVAYNRWNGHLILPSATAP